jgi:hypothetical protein
MQNENLVTVPIDTLWLLLASGSNRVFLTLHKEVKVAYIEVDAYYLFVVHAGIEFTAKFADKV